MGASRKSRKRSSKTGPRHARLRSVFELDLRSLAAMRIALGALVVIDLVNRARAFTAHYTDAGVLPAEVLARLNHPLRPSLHAVSGDAWLPALLFVAAAVFGLMLMVGYRTRLATVASWALMVSLHSRNPWVVQGGDDLFRLLLFWGMFLPLGARWSIDRIRAGDDRGHPGEVTFTMATVAVVAQACFLYAFATASKLGHSVWWPEGMGVYYALSVEQFTTRLGFVLLELPWLLRALSYVTLVLQALVPLLLLLPWQRDRLRVGLVVLMMGWHIGFALTMEIGLFSWITCAMWLAFLPPMAWSWLGDRLGRWRVTSRAHRRWGVLVEQLRARLGPDTTPEPETRRHLVDTAPARAILALLIVYSLWWNLWRADKNINRMPESMEAIGRLLRLDQRWHMFSSPPRWSQWFVIAGTKENGDQVDAFNGGPVSYEKPELISATFPNQRWRKYFNNISRRDARAHHPHLAAYVCRRWNDDHDGADRIVSVKLVRMRQSTPRRPGLDHLPADRVVLDTFRCPPGS